MDLQELSAAVRQFAEERDWQQFHTPKNLAISVAVEAAELMELVQWRYDDEVAGFAATASGREAFSEEIADVLIYLIRLADVLGIDLMTAAREKLAKNGQRYRVDESRGSADKR